MTWIVHSPGKSAGYARINMPNESSRATNVHQDVCVLPVLYPLLRRPNVAIVQPIKEGEDMVPGGRPQKCMARRKEIPTRSTSDRSPNRRTPLPAVHVCV